MDSADLVGFIVGEDQNGWYIYACREHTPDEIAEQTHRQVLRDEAEQSGATCHECGLELWEVEGLD